MLYIGVDGGGTKTLFSLFDENGTLLKSHVEPTTHYAQVGYDGVTQTLQRGIEALVKDEDPSNVCIGLGLAGYGREIMVRQNLEKAVEKAVGKYTYVLKNDAEIALMGALDGQDGILVIAGTGSIALSQYQGQSDRCGGWGYAIGDEGSAYWVAKQVLAEFSKQSDGRKPRTALYEIVKNGCQLDQDADLITHVIKTLENKRENIASLAVLCARGAAAGDEACLAIYRHAAREISEMINVLASKMDLETVLVSYTGGVWKGKDYMMDTFDACLNANVSIIAPLHGPDYGAYLYAKKGKAEN